MSWNSVLNEAKQRYGRSAHTMAMLQALQQQVISKQKEIENQVQETVAYYLTLLEVLENVDVKEEQEAAQAAFCLLEFLVTRVDAGWLQKYYERSMSVLLKLIESSKDNVGAMRHLIACLSRVLSVMDTTLWPNPLVRVPFQLLLLQCKEQRAKIRKAAHYGLAEVFRAVSKSFILPQLSALVAQECKGLLEAPQKHISSSSSNKVTQTTLAAGAVKEALQFLNAMKLITPLMDGGNAFRVCTVILSSFQTGQQLLILSGAEVIDSVLSVCANNLDGQQVAEILSQLLRINPEQLTTDVKTLTQFIKVVSDGLIKLQQQDSEQALKLLSTTYHTVTPLINNRHAEVQMFCGQALIRIIQNCIKSNEHLYEGEQDGKPAPIYSIIGCMQEMTSTNSMQCWPMLLPVVGEFFKAVQQRGCEVCQKLLEWVSEVTRLSIENQEENQYWRTVKSQSENVLGLALRIFGPRYVLQVLPLNIEKVAVGKEEEKNARAWLIPLIKREVREVELAAWGDTLLPLARLLGTRFNQLSSQSGEASNLHALELQIWGTLPSFGCWAKDIGEAFDKYIQVIGTAFVKRIDLRTPICSLLQKVCSQTRLALQVLCPELRICENVAAGQCDQLQDDDAAAAMTLLVSGDSMENCIPEWYTSEIAQTNLQVVQKYSELWVSALLDEFWKVSGNQGQVIGDAVAQYTLLMEEQVCARFFKEKFQVLLKATAGVQEGKDSVEGLIDAPVDALVKSLDICLFLANGLKLPALEMLFKTLSLLIDNQTPAVQKKVYKILAYFIGKRVDFRKSGGLEQALQLLNDNVDTVVSAAKRFRMLAIQPIILALFTSESGCQFASQTLENKQQILYSLLTEVVLCIKESNTKTRNLAYSILVDMGKVMRDMEEEEMDDVGSTPLQGMLTVVMAGLGGKTHHTMSASLMGMARLLYEFMPQLSQVLPHLLPAVMELLKIKSNELITAVLGFTKVVVMRAPGALLEELLPEILQGVLLYAEESKHKYKLHVRLIVQRLAKRCGYDMVEKHMPQSDRKLLSHIRQQQNKKTRKRLDNDMQLDFEVGSQRSFGKSMKKSEWGHTKVFEVEEEEQDQETLDMKSHKTKQSGKSLPPSLSVLEVEQDGEPMDLQDINALGKIFVPNNQGKEKKESYKDFETDDLGKIIIKEDEISGKKRSKRENDDMDIDSNDSEDGGGDIKGVLGIKQSGSQVPKSYKMSQNSARSRGGSIHSGQRFKAKKGAGGDVKRKAKLEPYAYVKLNRQMLNRRTEKRKHARKELDTIVKAVKVGATKAKKRKINP